MVVLITEMVMLGQKIEHNFKKNFFEKCPRKKILKLERFAFWPFLTWFLSIFRNENLKTFWPPEREFHILHILSATTNLYLYSFGRNWRRKEKKEAGKEMKLSQVRSPMVRRYAPPYVGHHWRKGRGDQVLTYTCHVCTRNCFFVFESMN